MSTHKALIELVGVRRRTLGTLFSAEVCGGVGVSAGISVASVLGAEILGSNAGAGLPGSMHVLGTALASLPFSALMARVGRRPGLSLGYALGAMGGACCIAASSVRSFPLLLLGMFLYGFGNTSNQLARYAAADVSLAAQRGRAISLVVWGATAGAVAGPNLLALAGRWANMLALSALAGPYLVGCTAFAVAGALCWLLLRPDPLAIARRMAVEDSRRATQAPARPLSVILRQPLVQVALLTLLASHLVMIATSQMTPVFLHDHGQGLPVIGLVISGHVAGMYAISPLAGWLCDRVGRFAVIAMGGLTFIAAVTINAVAPAEQSGWVLLGLFLVGDGWNFGFVAGSTLITDSVTPAERATVQGLADLLMGVVAATGSAFAGLIVEAWSYPALNGLAVVFVIVPALAIWLRRTGSALLELSPEAD